MLSTFTPLHLLLLLGLILCVSAPACDALNGTSAPSTPPSTLAEAEARWAAQGFDVYQYRFTRTCFCSPERLSATITVHDGTVAALDDISANGVSIAATRYAFRSEMAWSIEQLFGLLRDAKRGRIDSVAVTYESEWGYPRSLFVDPLQAMSGEEVTFSARAVRALPDSTARRDRSGP